MTRVGRATDVELQKAIDGWRELATELVDTIGAWRDAEPERRAYEYWSNESTKNSLTGDTTIIVGEVLGRFPKLDPAPVQRVEAAVAAWCEDRDVEGIPPQNELYATLRAAIVLLQSLEWESRRRIAREEPAPPSGDARMTAGRIVAAAIAEDPETRAGWRRARAQLLAFAAAAKLAGGLDAGRVAYRTLASVWAAGRQIYKAELDRLITEFRAEEQKDREEWTAEFGEPYPATLEDWIEQAARAGVDPDYLLRGEYTLADVAPIIQGYLRRRLDETGPRGREPAVEHAVADTTGCAREEASGGDQLPNRRSQVRGGKRGRTQAEQERLVEDWTRAKDTGVSKKEHCGGNAARLRRLDNALRAVRRRKSSN